MSLEKNKLYKVSNHYDETSNYYTIDVITDTEDNFTVAVVNGTTGDVWYINSEYRTNPLVTEAIIDVKQKIKRTMIVYGKKEYPKNYGNS